MLLRFVWSAILLERVLTDFLFGHGNLYSFAIEFLCLEGDFMVFDLLLSLSLPLVVDPVSVLCVLLVLTLVLATSDPGAEVIEMEGGRLV